jgi:hypothetical protein
MEGGWFADVDIGCVEPRRRRNRFSFFPLFWNGPCGLGVGVIITSNGSDALACDHLVYGLL